MIMARPRLYVQSATELPFILRSHTDCFSNADQLVLRDYLFVSDLPGQNPEQIRQFSCNIHYDQNSSFIELLALLGQTTGNLLRTTA